ncbi:MAG TPA: ABC transporter ATP-binding protein [Candidatus Dormibacteraeota bacterium]|jgi:ABC-2 type transport system ATP-binding protein|nr:ABC transporter ATP-binding protein [Candidatus Dormibacteraeota bacterium]
MADVTLEVENLVKVYSSRGKSPVRAVDGLSFSVPRGIIFGLLGPNGAGKSTLLRVLTTLTRPTEGTARILGIDVVKKPLEVRRRISSVIQETAAELLLSVHDNLLTYARFQNIPRAEAHSRAESLIDEFQLRAEVERKVQDLSGGFRRRVQVAKVFMVNTPVLFLDEFSTGMDPILKRQVMNRLRAETEKGRTIILTTQILSEAEELCDDILIINKGRQIARGDLSALKLLSQGVHDILLTFDRLPDSIAAEIAALQPIRQNVSGNSIELTLKAVEGRVMEIVTELTRNRRILHVEVHGASLEDIFVELTTHQKEPA